MAFFFFKNQALHSVPAEKFFVGKKFKLVEKGGVAGTPGSSPTAQGQPGESFYAGAGAKNVDSVIHAVHISAKFDRVDRFEFIEEIGSMLSWFGQMFGQNSARSTQQKA